MTKRSLSCGQDLLIDHLLRLFTLLRALAMALGHLNTWEARAAPPGIRHHRLKVEEGVLHKDLQLLRG